MQSIELTARTLDEAKKTAAAKLGVELSQVQATVLEESKGLFGKTTLRVRVDVHSTPEPKPVPDVAVATVADQPVEAREESPKPESGRGVGSGRRGRGKPKPEPEGANPAEGAVEAVVEVVEEEGDVVASPEDAEKLANLLREIVASADLVVTVKVTEISGRYVNLELDGKDVAFLVGKHGEVLNALQYLINIIGNRKVASGVRATLDGNHYRKRREETLTQLATNIAEQVRERGEEAVLDALPAFERRIVHKALSTLPGITTYSEGEEPNRRVVIAPAE
jgi:spoIIIJ-associated protein